MKGFLFAFIIYMHRKMYTQKVTVGINVTEIKNNTVVSRFCLSTVALTYQLFKMQIFTSYLCILVIIRELTAKLPEMYRGNVHKNSILRTLNVTSISNCLFQCVDLYDDCFAVGFLSTDLKKSNTAFVTCHMIKEQGDGETVTLEVFVSSLKT